MKTQQSAFASFAAFLSLVLAQAHKANADACEEIVNANDPSMSDGEWDSLCEEIDISAINASDACREYCARNRIRMGWRSQLGSW